MHEPVRSCVPLHRADLMGLNWISFRQGVLLGLLYPRNPDYAGRVPATADLSEQQMFLCRFWQVSPVLFVFVSFLYTFGGKGWVRGVGSPKSQTPTRFWTNSGPSNSK